MKIRHNIETNWFKLLKRKEKKFIEKFLPPYVCGLQSICVTDETVRINCDTKSEDVKITSSALIFDLDTFLNWLHLLED